MNFITLMIIAVFLLFQINSIVAWVAQGNASHPDYPGRCYISEDEIFPSGRFQPENKCEILDCDGETGMYTLEGCGSAHVNMKGYNCTRGDFVDRNIPHPGCCKWKFECVNDEGDVKIVIAP